MYDHFIILYSDYKSGRRIAYHKSDTDITGLFVMSEIMESLNQEFIKQSFGFHHLRTRDSSWTSVIEYDRFFVDVKPCSDLEQFKAAISEDRKVSALDVANLMTAHIKCTHLKLQKLLYVFYCEYIKRYKEKPFEEDFYAWQYGPVIKEVYDRYKVFGRLEIDAEDDTKPIDKAKPFKLSVSSKFMKTPLHQEILHVLEDTVDQYGAMNAYDLVNLTHLPGGPWDRIYKQGSGRDQIIPYYLIEDYCITETYAK